ncbi:MAG: acyl--CoA ligase [Lachnospiraceae bacterium]|nr:acyl--CoA ligase [Lachnospiraceae bacterium]
MHKKKSIEKNMTGYPSIDKPWLKYYSQEVIDAPLPECTIYEHIFNNNQDNLDRIALVYYGTKISYRQMFQEISYIAGTLEDNGIKEGDIVTVCMINSPETIYLIFALSKIGAVANMVYGASTSEELKKYILDVKSKIVFTLDLFQDKFAQIAGKTQLEKIVVAGSTDSMSLTNQIGARLFKGIKPISLPDDPRFVTWKKFFANKEESKRMCHNADAPAVITYTGGTTGGSKGALLSNRAIIAVAQQYIMGEQELQRESIWMQVLPLFIAYGVTCSLMIPLTVGMTLNVRIPMAESIADFYKKFKPNHIMYGPAYWEAFADANENLDLSNLIAPITGGDVLHAATETKINDYLQKHGSPYLLMNGYGMTEVGAAVSVNYKYAHEFGSVGIPFVKNVIAAFDTETGQELRYGERGEICIQTPSMMLGYINNPEETNNIIKRHKEGQLWVHSGDLGYISEDGFVHISGRLKRYMLYIANGVQKKIFSLDIEKVLLEHSYVDNCAVVPIADSVTFQKPVAFIILKKDLPHDVNTENELKEYAEKNLQDGYKPIKYIFVDRFPLTKVGKVDYLALEKKAEGN